MRQDEMRDAGALLGTTLAEVAELARDVHAALAHRVFGALGPLGLPAQIMHNAIATSAYAATRVGVATLPALAGATAAAVAPPRADGLADIPAGHAALAALNGFWGDRLALQRPSLAPTLRMRTHEGPLRSEPANVAHDVQHGGSARTARRGAGSRSASSPPTPGRLVVFVHGLCETDRFWSLGAQKAFGDNRTTYGSLLREERGWTPVYVDLNTGLRISENGQRLDVALEEVVAAWPQPVEEIALVGHSMGGLIIRSAAHQAHERDARWVKVLRHVVGLGSPHLGAPLERWVNTGTAALGRLPETRPFAAWLNRRSVGIKDLRYGAVLESDWLGHNPDERLVDRCGEAVLLPGVAYSMVSATLSTRPEGRFAHDLLVEHTSAHATKGHRSSTRRIEFEVDRLTHVGRRHHFNLLCDPVVYRQLRTWLDGADGAAPPAGTV